MLNGMIKGYVRNNSNNQGIAGAHVTASDKDYGTLETYSSDGNPATGPVGYYEIPHTSPDTFTMHCEASGYANWNKSGVTLTDGQTKALTIKMNHL